MIHPNLIRGLSAFGYTIKPIDIYGPFVIAQFVSIFLLGVIWVIAWLYFDTQRKDYWGNKALVTVLVILATLDTAFACSRVVKLTVLNQNNLIYFLDIGSRFEDWTIELLVSIECLLSQTFMVWRTFTFARAMRLSYGNKTSLMIWITASVSIVGLLLCWGTGIGIAIYLSQLKSYTQVLTHTVGNYGNFSLFADIQISSFLALDILITIAMTVELRLAKTGFQASNAVLDVLVSAMLRNGLVVTVLQMVELLVFHLTSSAWADFPRGFLGKIYCLTVLSILLLPKMVQERQNAKLDREALQVPGEKHIYHAHIPGIGLSLHSGSATGTGMDSGPTEKSEMSHREGGGNSLGTSTAITQNSGSGSRCRSCGNHSSGLGLGYGTPKLGYGGGVGTPKLGGYSNSLDLPRELGVSVLRKDGMEGLIGFKAALMGLEEDDGSNGSNVSEERDSKFDVESLVREEGTLPPPPVVS